MKYKVIHKTVYEYSEEAALSQNRLCLFPRDTYRQFCDMRNISITPQPSSLDIRTDYFGNYVHHFMVQQPHQKLEIILESILNTSASAAPVPVQTPAWEKVRDVIYEHKTEEDLNACNYIFSSSFIRLSYEFAEYAKISFYPMRPVLEAAIELTERIFKEFKYEKNATVIGTPLDEVLKNKKGVCQDFAHLQIACLRSIGLAARYVSGYMETIPPPGKPKMVGADASHAWLSIYVPGYGWIDLDPTNNMIPGERHISVAWGRDYGDVTPVKGVIWGGGSHKLLVAVDVTAL